MEKVELFFQSIRCTPLWLAIDLAFIGHFFVSWYLSYRKTKWKIDFWYFTLFIHFFVFVFAMYPFNGSFYNMKSTGSVFFVIDPFIDKAFFITIVGYFFIWLGRYVYDVMKWEFPLFQIFKLFSPFLRVVQDNVRSQKAVFSIALFSFASFTSVFLIQAKNGYILNPRDFFIEHHTLRPLYNCSISLLQITLVFLAIQYLQFKNKWAKYFYCFFIFISFFLGIRGTVIFSLLTFLIYRFFSRKGSFNVLKFFGQGLGLIIIGIFIDNIRHQEYNPLLVAVKLFSQVFYGNHFSDTRDFAWVLSCWDEQFVYGKTYLAGLLSFLPRFLSDFRQEWALSIYTNSLVGFDSEAHAGLRPGTFGEAYLNFGFAGVITLGFLAGYFLRYSDVKLKEAINKENDLIKGYSKTIVYYFISCFFVTAGFWGLYIFILTNLLLLGLRRVKIVKSLS